MAFAEKVANVFGFPVMLSSSCMGKSKRQRKLNHLPNNFSISNRCAE